MFGRINCKIEHHPVVQKIFMFNFRNTNRGDTRNDQQREIFHPVDQYSFVNDYKRI